MREATTICPRPLQFDFYLLTLKVVSGSRVTWPTVVPILVFDLGGAENAGPENVGPESGDQMAGVEMQDLKLQDQITWVENAGYENGGPNNRGGKCRT